MKEDMKQHSLTLEQQSFKDPSTLGEKQRDTKISGPLRWDSGDAEKMRHMIARDRELHDEGRKIGGKLHRMALKSGFRLTKGDVDGARGVLCEGLSCVASLVVELTDDEELVNSSCCKVNAVRTKRYAASSGVEDAAGALLFYHWISHKEILTLSGLKDTLSNFKATSFQFSDVDFIAGCCKLADSISHYSIMMASELDFKGIKFARDTVSALHGYLLQLNFRNGRNRRQFDVVKYKVQLMDNLLLQESDPPPPLPNRLWCKLIIMDVSFFKAGHNLDDVLSSRYYHSFASCVVVSYLSRG